MIGAAIEETAERHVNRVVDDQQSAALVLHGRKERRILVGESVSYVDRPARLDGSVLQGQREDKMARPRSKVDSRIEKQSPARRIDDRRAGDAKRSNVTTRQCLARHGRSQFPLPDRLAIVRIKRIDDVVFGHGDEQGGLAAGRLPIERLREKLSGNFGMEGRIEMQRFGAIPGQGRDDEVPAAIGAAVIGQN